MMDGSPGGVAPSVSRAPRPRILSAFVTIGVLQIVVMLLQLVRTKVLAVLLGAEAIGIMGVIDKLLAVIAQTVSLSFPFAAARFLPAFWTTDRAAFRSVFRGMRFVLTVTVGCTTVGAMALALVAPATWGHELIPFQSTLLLALCTLPAVAAVPFLQNVFAGRLDQNGAMVMAVANGAVLTLAALVGAWWHGLSGFYGIYAVLGFVVTIAAIRFAERGTPSSDDRFSQSWKSIPPAVWRFGAIIFLLAFLAPYAALFAHYRVLSEHGPLVAGWMQAAIGVSLIVRVALGAAHGAFLVPNVSRGGQPEERIAWAHHFQWALCVICGLSVPMLVLFPDLVIRLLYSPELAPGAKYAAVFVAAEFIGLVAATNQMVIVALDHVVYYVVQNLAAQLLLVLVAAVTIAPLGVFGAGVAGICAQLLLYGTTTVFLKRRYGAHTPTRTIATSLFVLTAIVVAGVVGVRWSELTTSVIGSKVALYVATVAGLWLLLSSSQRAELADAVKRVRARIFP